MSNFKFIALEERIVLDPKFTSKNFEPLIMSDLEIFCKKLRLIIYSID